MTFFQGGTLFESYPHHKLLRQSIFFISCSIVSIMVGWISEPEPRRYNSKFLPTYIHGCLLMLPEARLNPDAEAILTLHAVISNHLG